MTNIARTKEAFPGCLRAGQDYSFASDIWSVGMVLFELATGRYPFEEQGIGELEGSHGLQLITSSAHLSIAKIVVAKKRTLL